MPGDVALLASRRIRSSSSSTRRSGSTGGSGPYDIEQSRAHAKMLAEAGSSRDADRDALLERARARRGGARRGRVPVPPGRRGHPHGDRAPADGDRRPGRRQAAHRPLAQRPGRDRHGDVHARARARRRSSGCSACRARSSSSPTATSTGRCPATRTSSARSRSTWPTTCSRTSGCSGATRGGSSTCSARPRDLPLGAGALAGVNFDDRPRPGRRASSASPASRRTRSTPSPTATSCSTTSRPPPPARRTSRASGAEIVLWSSEEFGFCEVSDAWASGSSIMPQKKNPDAAELLRAKAPRVVGAPGRAARRAARPPAHLQQGHAGGQGAPVRRRRHARPVPAGGAPGCSAAIAFDRERLAGAAADEMIAAVDVADMLVRRGVPFRQSHGIVAGLVREAVDSGRTLSELTREELARHSEALDDEYYAVLSRAVVARVQGLRGRHRARPRPRAARARAGGARRPARLTLSHALLRPPGGRGRARPARLRRAPRRHAPA